MKKAYRYVIIDGVRVKMYCQEKLQCQTVRGKGMYNRWDKEFLFIQDGPSGPRSKELMRTAHSRLVRRPDGLYTLTFRFSDEEHGIMKSLVNEMKEIAKRNYNNIG
ncbi:MAG: hypothetical protein K5867_07675 [Bacteroidales bacterium]|nr:hypothetical protein [Bacteroidales bacterium]